MQQLVLASEAAVESLKNEAKEIEEKIPLLEAEKKSAASKRDFRVAGKANKAIKEAVAQKERLEEELDGKAVEKVATAKADLEKLTDEPETKKSVAHKKERENGVQNMTLLARKMKQLERIKKRVCSKSENGEKTVSFMGAVILDQEIDNLNMEGEALGAKFGGWDAIKNEVDETSDPEDEDAADDNECNGAKSETSHEATVDGKGEEQESDDIPNTDKSKDESDNASHNAEQSDDKDDKPNNDLDKESALKKYKDLTGRIKELESQLEEAVEQEDYDTAAELDQEFQDLKSEIEALGLSDSDIELLTDGEENLDEEDNAVSREDADESSVTGTEPNDKELNGTSNLDVTADEGNVNETDVRT